MQKSTRASLLAMATLALAGIGSGGLEQASGNTSQPIRAENGTRQVAVNDRGTNPSRLGERNSIEKALLGGFGRRGHRSRYPNGPGWTQAHVQRMARKRRNQRRNKRAHRG